MKKRILVFAFVLLALTACISLSSCSDPSVPEKYRDEGKTVTVKYDANGGEYLGRTGITIMDMFDPTDYQVGSDGLAHIKLMEPTDARRPTGTSDKVNLTKPGYFYIGWYKERNAVTDSDGNFLGEDGQIIYKNGNSYYKDKEFTELAEPAYEYSGYWDFENDTVDCKADGSEETEMTLYAGWVKFFEFNYFIEDNGSWKKLDKITSFDYKTVHGENSSTSDKDTIWVPAYPEEMGAMVYTHKYKNGSTYEFPKIDGTTFLEAYTDEKCENTISVSHTHKGYVDLATGKAVDPVQNIYIKTVKGNRLKIKTAKQLVDNPDPSGIYEIMNDLDFTGLDWPLLFSTSEFKGRIESTEGNTFKLSNINAVYSSTNAQFGGLFGKISSTGVVKNVAFENVTFDISKAVSRMPASIGLVSGMIEDGAEVAVSLTEAKMRLGDISFSNGSELFLICGGNDSGITINGKVKLTVYGDGTLKEYSGNYDYSIDPESVSVDDNKITFVSRSYKDPENMEIEIAYGE